MFGTPQDPDISWVGLEESLDMPRSVGDQIGPSERDPTKLFNQAGEDAQFTRRGSPIPVEIKKNGV
jgi:hypothetical protein